MKTLVRTLGLGMAAAFLMSSMALAAPGGAAMGGTMDNKKMTGSKKMMSHKKMMGHKKMMVHKKTMVHKKMMSGGKMKPKP